MPLARVFRFMVEARCHASRPTSSRLIGYFVLAPCHMGKSTSRGRVLLNETQFCFGVVRSVCYKTKTPSLGQGLHRDGLAHCWGQIWMQLLRQALKRTSAVTKPFVPDFIFPVSAVCGFRSFRAERVYCLDAPAERTQCFRLLRFLLQEHSDACQTPQAETMERCQSLGVHSMKSTLLSWARQLQVPDSWRKQPRHHRSATTGSSIVHDALLLQARVARLARKGWRPVMPQLRGAVSPKAELSFSLPAVSGATEAVLKNLGKQLQALVEPPEVSTHEPVQVLKPACQRKFAENEGNSSSESLSNDWSPSSESEYCAASTNASVDKVDEASFIVNSVSRVAHAAVVTNQHQAIGLCVWRARHRTLFVSQLACES